MNHDLEIRKCHLIRRKENKRYKVRTPFFKLFFFFLSQGTYMNSEIIKSDGKWKEITT